MGFVKTVGQCSRTSQQAHATLAHVFSANPVSSMAAVSCLPRDYYLGCEDRCIVGSDDECDLSSGYDPCVIDSCCAMSRIPIDDLTSTSSSSSSSSSSSGGDDDAEDDGENERLVKRMIRDLNSGQHGSLEVEKMMADTLEGELAPYGVEAADDYPLLSFSPNLLDEQQPDHQKHQQQQQQSSEVGFPSLRQYHHVPINRRHQNSNSNILPSLSSVLGRSCHPPSFCQEEKKLPDLVQCSAEENEKGSTTTWYLDKAYALSRLNRDSKDKMDCQTHARPAINIQGDPSCWSRMVKHPQLPSASADVENQCANQMQTGTLTRGCGTRRMAAAEAGYRISRSSRKGLAKKRVVFSAEVKQILDEAVLDKIFNPEGWHRSFDDAQDGNSINSGVVCIDERRQKKKVVSKKGERNKMDLLNASSPRDMLMLLPPKLLNLIYTTGLTCKQIKQYMYNNAAKGGKLARMLLTEQDLGKGQQMQF